MIVVDTVAIVDALGAADRSEELHRRLASETLHAPALLDYKLVSVLRQLCLNGRISAARAADLLKDFEDLPVQRWISSGAFAHRTFELRHHVSSCDAAFIVLAEALECPLVTRDARLAAGTRPHRTGRSALAKGITEWTHKVGISATARPVRPDRTRACGPRSHTAGCRKSLPG